MTLEKMRSFQGEHLKVKIGSKVILADEAEEALNEQYDNQEKQFQFDEYEEKNMCPGAWVLYNKYFVVIPS